MKNIFNTVLIVFLLIFTNSATAQVDENGRTAEQRAKRNSVNHQNKNKEDHTKGQEDDIGDDGQYVSEGTGETIDISKMMSKLIELEDLVETLSVQNEMLSTEVLDAKLQSEACCLRPYGNKGDNGYLLQLAPNPFYDKTTVGYYVADRDAVSKIEVRDLKGVLLLSFDLNQNGEGSIQISATNLASGTYVYSLNVNGQIIDSKLMIMTN